MIWIQLLKVWVRGVFVFCVLVVLTECPSPGTLVKGKIEQDNLLVLDVFPRSSSGDPPFPLPVYMGDVSKPRWGLTSCQLSL